MGKETSHGSAAKRKAKRSKDQEPPLAASSAASSSSSASMRDPAVTRSKQEELDREDEQDEYLICRLANLSQLFKLGYQVHTTCNQPLIVCKTNNQIISCSLHLYCVKCHYKSPSVNMYETLSEKLDHLLLDENEKEDARLDRRGPKHSQLNVRLACALTASPIGASVFSEIMCELGVNPGSVDGLHRLINRVGAVNEKGAKISMRAAIKDLVKKKKKGEEIVVAVDAQYNNRLRNKFVPSELATQAVHTTVATNTKKIVAQQCVSKLCNTCSRIQTDSYLEGNLDYTNLPLCSRPDCKRNLLPQATISDEGSMLNKSLRELEEEGLKVDVVVCDGDSRTAKVVKEKGIEINSDIRHKSNNIVKKINRKAKMNFKDFKGPTLAEKKKECALFVTSIMKRCNAENKQAAKLCKSKKGIGKLNCVKGKLKNVSKAILACHQGNCGKLCYYHSNVCHGYSSKQKTYAKCYAKSGPQPKLCNKNVEIIQNMIKERLEANISVTYRNAGTNIVESYNRAYMKSCPKISAFSRNYKNRHNKSVIMINEGLVKGSKLVRDMLKMSIPQSVVARQRKILNRRLRSRAYAVSLKKKIRHEARTHVLQNLYKNKRQSKKMYGKGIDWK